MMWVCAIILLLAWSVAMVLLGVHIGWRDCDFYNEELRSDLDRWMNLARGYEKEAMERYGNDT